MEDILGEPRVHVPNELPTHPTLMLDPDFIHSDDSFRSDLEVSFSSGTRNKNFDPGIFFEVQSKRFLSRNTFSISFIRNLLCPVIETLLPFLSKNEDKEKDIHKRIKTKPNPIKPSTGREKSVKSRSRDREQLSGPLNPR
ncbi:hypothetical protein Tco_0724774 [Tanacetum coccineum]|uniref:Uncharacterized protein n=1 Tax=Tanacetum coccineum TaxID=301880 RepID=A0ABQ4YB48_9ASTR